LSIQRIGDIISSYYCNIAVIRGGFGDSTEKKGMVTMKKRLIALLLTTSMFMGAFPVQTLAAGVSGFENADTGEFETETSQEETPLEKYQGDTPAEEFQEEMPAENNFTGETVPEGDGEALYQGQAPDYEDPEFVNRLQDGFFAGSGASARSSYGTVHDDRFQDYTIEDGIDVSEWNGDIDWDTVADQIDFAMIRGGYRGIKDPGNLKKDLYFEDNIQEALSAGLDVGVYIYSQAVSKEEAREEAAYILDLVDGYSFDLPIVIDYEFADGGRLSNAGLSKSQHTNICLAFCEAIEKAGYSAMVYANQNMLTDSMDGQRIIDEGYEIWMAQYRSSSTYTGDYTYWQYTETGSMKGIIGNVDLDYHYLPPSADTRLKTPALLSAEAKDDSVKITWKTVPGADGYLVYRKSEGSGWTALGTSDAGEYTDERSLVSGTDYIYTVRAYRGSYEEAKEHKFDVKYWSSYHSSGIRLSYLSQPVLKKAAIGSGGVQVTWDTVLGADGYYIYRRALGKSWTRIRIANGTSYTDSEALKSGTTYIYTVRAYHGSDRSSYKNTGIRLYYLSTPKLKGAAKTSGNIHVTWDAVPGASGYYIYRRTPGNSWNRIASAASANYTDKSSFKKGTTYIYTVRAYYGSDRSYYENSGTKIKY
jgi:GH25 family lysozyme M1 (1,4-beta-N-acetylmuramidase)